MRRLLLPIVGLLALALAAPSLASAHGRHGHHKHHRHHHAHRAQAPSASSDAGTVTSFDGGVLTIALAGGSSVSGRVTNDTEIGCVVAIPPPAAPTAVSAHHGDDDDGGWSWHHCGGHADCDASDLVAGAVVHAADLQIGSQGAEFESVTLVKQQDS